MFKKDKHDPISDMIWIILEVLQLDSGLAATDQYKLVIEGNGYTCKGGNCQICLPPFHWSVVYSRRKEFASEEQWSFMNLALKEN